MTQAASIAQHITDTPRGFAFALGAFGLWGFLPLYMKLLDHVGPIEVVAHRIIWSVPLAGALLIVLRRTADLRAALRSPRTLMMGAVTATLISVNWLIYVWAVTSGNAVDAALGNYINPLFSIFLGAVLLGERLKRTQMVAVVLAALAVCILTWFSGGLPWADVGLTVSWGLYALAKKQLPIGPNQGFLLEVLLLLPFALGYIVWLTSTGQGHFSADPALLMGCGIVTAVPLILYANGAKLLRLSTIGIMQYIAPTMIFVIAVFVFGEALDTGRKIALPMIWVALVIYSLPMIRDMRRASTPKA